MTGPGNSAAAYSRGRSPSADTIPLRAVEHFGANPGKLLMFVHIPAALKPGAPLVVVLHGCGQSALDYARGAGWIALSDRFGFAVLCPEQTRANNGNLCFNWFQTGDIARDKGEVGSIHAMTQHALGLYALDAGRVFVTGLSAGGAMAAALLATYPEVFAAGAILAGIPYGAASNVSEAFSAMYLGQERSAQRWGDGVRRASTHTGRWPRVSIWQGEVDGVVRPTVADEIVRQWTDVHGVAQSAGVTQTRNGRELQVWRSATGETVVELNRIAGMGHGAPIRAGGADGYGTAAPYCLETGISSSLEITQFWRIVDERAANDQSTAPAARPKASRFPLAPPAVAGLGDVITSALRTAGILK